MVSHAAEPASVGEAPSRAELLAALSVAIDLGLGQPAEHMLRAATIATRLAERLGLTGAQRDCVYYTTLVMWIGCHADSHEYARWFGDDIAVRHDSYLVDWSGLLYWRFLLGNIGRGQPLTQRLTIMATLFANARGQLSRLIHSHCTSAALLADRIGLGPDVQVSLVFAFERYDGGGLHAGAHGDEIPIQMRVAQLAEMVEVHHRTYGLEGAVAMARGRRGGQFDPKVVDTFIHNADAILAGSAPGDAWPAALREAPDRHQRLDDKRAGRAAGRVRRLRRPQMSVHAWTFARGGGSCRRRGACGRARCRRGGADSAGGPRTRPGPHRGVEPNLVQARLFDRRRVRAGAAASLSDRPDPQPGPRSGPAGRSRRKPP